MGTSSARRAPTTPLWRLAKAAATRYLAPAGAGAVAAGEVVARYLAALGEGAGEASAPGLAACRFTRRVAQDLGAFGSQAAFLGLPAALAAWGLGELAAQPWTLAAQGLGALLAGAGGGLEEAVVRTSLAAILMDLQPGKSGSGPQGPAPEPVAPDRLVREFLAGALYVRLALDLGEPLEAAAGGGAGWQQGLAGLRERIAGAARAAGAGAAPALPAEWRGLPGWSWVTEVMGGMMRLLKEPGPAR